MAARYTELKDAPIVAAARRTHVDYLVSLDRRHLVDVPEVALRSGLKIILPGALLAHLRLPSHPILDVEVDDELQLLVRKPESLIR